MNIQQLEYIVAVEKFRHFAKAASYCNVTQPTLSMMIHKLEEELNIEIFDRTKSPVEVNPVGDAIIKQAKRVLLDLAIVKEIAEDSKSSISGELRFSIIPTIAPYLLPQMFKKLKQYLPDLHCTVSEMRTQVVIDKLKRAEIDLAIVSTPLNDPQILELPLYYERFLVYVSSDEELHKKEFVEGSDLIIDKLWILEEGHCFRAQTLNICNNKRTFQQYEAGSIDNLVKVVDLNGGYTLIPELHFDCLSELQKKNVRKFSGAEPRREVSLIFRQDFYREKLLNEILRCVKEIIPEGMMDKRLSKFRIKL